MSHRDISSLFSLLKRGGYGTLAGIIASILAGLSLFFLPQLINLAEFGDFCYGQTVEYCDDTKLWVVNIVVVGALIGAIAGALVGLLGKKAALRIFGPGKERIGTVAGGLIGGILPWAILWVLTQTV